MNEDDTRVTWGNEARLTDFIKIRDGVIPEHLCKLMVEEFEKDSAYHVESLVGADEKDQALLKRATIEQNLIDGKAIQHEDFYRQGTEDKSGRHAIEMNCSQRIIDSPQWHKIIKFMKHSAVQEFLKYKAEMIANGYPPYMFPRKFRLEEWRMHRYDANEHYFKDHIDSIDEKSAKRFLAFQYYPVTVKEGGETAFAWHLKGVECKPKMGRLLISPTWMGYPHEGKTPLSGTKYMLKTYFHYPNEGDI